MQGINGIAANCPLLAPNANGRLLVIEYKGAHIADGPDTTEKRTIGRLWEETSGSKGLFVVVERAVDGKDMQAQMVARLG